MANSLKNGIQGCFPLANFYAEDSRGSFLKVFQRSRLPEQIRNFQYQEGFVSNSRKNVLRGMHFQTPPYDLDKLVTVLQGKVLDVILDMRKESPTFGKTVSYFLGDGCEYRSLFIPDGCAHGFLSLCDQTLMLYQTTCEFHPEHDTGVRFDSIGFDWGIPHKELIISEKDLALPLWNPQESPFL